MYVCIYIHMVALEREHCCLHAWRALAAVRPSREDSNLS